MRANRFAVDRLAIGALESSVAETRARARARFYCAKTRTMKSAGSRGPRKNNGGTARQRNPRSTSRLSRSVKALDVARSRESLGIVLASHTPAPAPVLLQRQSSSASLFGDVHSPLAGCVSPPFPTTAIFQRDHPVHCRRDPPRPPPPPWDNATRAAVHEKRKRPLEEASGGEPPRGRVRSTIVRVISAWTGSGSCILVRGLSPLHIIRRIGSRGGFPIYQPYLRTPLR